MKIILNLLFFINIVFAGGISIADMQKYSQYKDILENSNTQQTQTSKVEIQEAKNDIKLDNINIEDKSPIDQEDITIEVDKNSFKYDTKEIELKRYGANFFLNKNKLESTSIPTSNDYVLKSADILLVNTFGSKHTNSYELTIDNNNNIFIQKIGTVKVGGLKFKDAKLLIIKKIKKSFSNTKVVVDIIKYSTIQVVLSGNVKVPGIYNLSPFSTIKDALMEANGLLDVGSYRDISIIREHKKVYSFDLYKLLLNPKANSDFSLRNNDIVMVNFVHKSIRLYGKVKYPAIYELKDSETFRDLLKYSGGFSYDATKNSIKLTRYNNDKQLKTYILSKKAFLKMKPKDGDKIEIFNNYDIKEKPYILVYGKVIKGDMAKYKYFDGMTVSQLFNMITFRSEIYNTNKQKIKEDKKDKENTKEVSFNIEDREALLVDKTKIKLIRNSDNTKSIFLLSATDNFVLKPFDEIEFYNYFDTHPRMKVTITGEVYKKGSYFINDNTTLKELLNLAGGMTEKAYRQKFELVRYKIKNNERVRDIKKYDLQKALNKDFKLKAHDEINIFTIPNWYDAKTVILKGEVKFPGVYNIKTGEKLSDVIQRAGGFTSEAFIEGAVFTRKSIKENEEKRMKEAMFKLKQQIAFISANSNEIGTQKKSSQELTSVVTMLEKQMQEYKALGRLVVYLDKNLQNFKTTPYDIRLEDKDMLVIPSFNDTVSVYGEVMNPSSFIYSDKFLVNDYITKAGGMTQSADEDSVYMVMANGEAKKVELNSLFLSTSKVKAGSTIVVPMKVNKVSNILVWKEVSQIVYQLAITAASLNTVGAI